MLRATIITDIHYGFDIRNKLGSQMPKLIDKFAKIANKSDSGFVVEMGDRISAKSRQDDQFYARQLKDRFNNIAKPVYHLNGNHDDLFLSRQDNENITGSPSSSYSIDYNGYHIIFWNPNVNVNQQPANGKRGINAEQEHLDWLKDDLAQTDKPTIVFSHFPLDSESLDRLPDNSPGRCFGYLNSHEIQNILEQSGKVILCMSGHNHEDRKNTINGIHYMTIQSVAEARRDDKNKPYGRYAELVIDNDSIEITLKSLNSKKHRVLVFTP